jgi:DNA-binding CsgD family transcriptional regulator
MKTLAEIICQPTFRNENKLKKLSTPIYQAFGLDTFWYYTLTEKGELSYVSNNSSVADFFYSNEIYKGYPYFKDPKLLTSGFFFCEKTADEEYHKTQGKVRNQFSMDQIFMVMNTEGSKTTGYGFAATQRLPDLTNTFFNNLFLFRKFINYFHREAEDILKQMKQHTVDIAGPCGKLFYSSTNHFTALSSPFNPDALTNAIDPFQFEALKTLSAREKDCLRWFLKGLSAVQIGKKIHLSNRTVEFYIDNVKNKLGCRTKEELYNALLDWRDFLNFTFF